jgi:diguanylate cyclase (GGDEF)-like protein
MSATETVAEADRLASLYGYGLLDTPEEDAFDRIVALAAEICGTPMALVTLIDADRQWFKSRFGVTVKEVPRDLSIAHLTVGFAQDVLVVPDTRIDERFRDSPLVTGDPYIRFYAAAVIRDRYGRALGTLCVLDRRQRHLSESQLKALVTLGQQVEALFELHQQSLALAHAEAALDASSATASRQAVITLDAGLRVIGWSGDAERLYGHPASATLGRRAVDVLRINERAPERQVLVTTLQELGWWEGDLTTQRSDGLPLRLHTRIERRQDPATGTVSYIARCADRTSPDIERLCHEVYSDVVTRIASGQDNAETLCTKLCHVVEGNFPGARATLMRMDAETGRLRLLAAPSMSEQFVEAIADVPVGAGIGSCGTAAHFGQVVISSDVATDPAWNGWREPVLAEGLRSCWSKPIFGPDGSVTGTFGVYWDRPHEPGDDERLLVATLVALAATILVAHRDDRGEDGRDKLTGLLSRGGLDRVLGQVNPDHLLVAMAVDVDRFGLVNLQYGLNVGDRALCAIAEQLTAMALDRDTVAVARIGSDEFVVVRVEDGDSVGVADALLRCVQRPIQVGVQELWLTASIGMARGSASQRQELLNRAISAARHARQVGGDRVVDADSPTAQPLRSNLELVGALHQAVAMGGLDVHYQPKLSVATGAVEGFEALLRWDLGGNMVPPSEFVPLAEEIGLIGNIGEQVLKRACQDAARWDCTSSAPTVAVNISGHQLVPGHLARTVAAGLRDSGLAPERLIVEVTETALAADMASAVTALEEVKALGVGISLDDFGAGYSSLSYLSRLPLDELKIDGSFVERLGQDPAADTIVRSVIALAKALGLHCVAECVERADQLELLTSLGCDTYQGYLFSPAVPRDHVPALLAGRRVRR